MLPRDKENEEPKESKEKKRKSIQNPVKRSIHFSKDVLLAEKDYESPYINLAKSSCSTPCNDAPNSNADTAQGEYSMKDVMDFVTSKFNEVLDAQEEHTRKLMKENAILRKKLLEVLGDGDKPDSLKRLKNAIKANRVSGDPLMFNGKDLMRFKPTEDGPSVFGRTIAAEIFGSEKNCMLAKERIGVKVNRRNSRGPCDAGLEELFVECVTRYYSDDTDEAVSRAVAGANQYGAEMKQKHSL